MLLAIAATFGISASGYANEENDKGDSRELGKKTDETLDSNRFFAKKLRTIELGELEEATFNKFKASEDQRRQNQDKLHDAVSDISDAQNRWSRGHFQSHRSTSNDSNTSNKKWMNLDESDRELFGSQRRRSRTEWY